MLVARSRGGARRCPAPVLVAVMALGGVVGCARADVPPSLPRPTTTTVTAPEPAPADRGCGDPAASLRPSGPAGPAVAAGSYMAEIQQRGRLRVGVDVGTLGMSAVDPATGEIEGFDVDIAREVAAALLGRRDAVQLVGIPSGERVDALVSGRVDLVASTFTPTCRRREEVTFSAPYITSGQRVLVRRGGRARSLADLAGRRVCATVGSTAFDNIRAQPDPPVAVPVVERADCLVLLQQGRIDAAATNDTILAGMAAQDPSLRLIGPPFSVEPASLGLPRGHDDWVRYVNAVLDDVRASGRWAQIYDRWLADVLGPSPGPPAPVYVG